MHRFMTAVLASLCLLGVLLVSSASEAASPYAYQKASIAEMQALGAASGTSVASVVVTGPQGGGSTFNWVSCGGAGQPSCTPDNVVTFAGGAGAPAGGIWQRKIEDGWITNQMASATAIDGTTDNTAMSQAAVNAGATWHLPVHILPNSVLGNATAPLLLNGSTYNGMSILLDHVKEGIRATTSTNNFQAAAFVAVALQSTTGVDIWGDCDQQNSLQPSEEHIYCIALAGTTGTKIPSFSATNIRGDGIYVSQSNLFASSTQNTGLAIGTLSCQNTSDDGRNCLSMISADSTTVAAMNSYHVGGIGTLAEPGGLDIEPNNGTYQSVNGFSLGSGNFVCGIHATTCIGVTGRLDGSGNNVVKNIDISANAQCLAQCASFVNVNHLTFNIDADGQGSGSAMQLDNANRVKGVLNGKSVFGVGVSLAPSTSVSYADLTINLTDFGDAAGCPSGYGILLTHSLTYSKLTMHLNETTALTQCPNSGFRALAGSVMSYDTISGSNYVNGSSYPSQFLFNSGATMTGVNLSSVISPQYSFTNAISSFCVAGVTFHDVRYSTLSSFTASAGAATACSPYYNLTTDSLTTAAGADYTLTVTDAHVTAISQIQTQLVGGTNTTPGFYVKSITIGAGSYTIVIHNGGSAALNGTLVYRITIQ